VGRHRKRQHGHPHRVSRGIALISAGVLLSLTGGAVVFAATGGPARPATRSPAGDGPGQRAAAAPGSRVRPPAGAASSSSPSAPPRPASTPSAQPSSPPRERIGFAPYADLLAWPPLGLAKEHAKAYTMGFVASAGGCSAAWDGVSPVDSASEVRRIKDVPGKVILAFGGPHAVDLAQTCDDVGDLASAYRKAIDVTHPSGIDFYLPEVALADSAGMRRRIEALTRVRRTGDVPLSLTLPLHQSGLSDAALDALRTAAGSGLQVAIVNLVPSDQVGQSVTAAANAAHDQLATLYHQGDAQVWQRMGVTPVIGVGAPGLSAPFRPADARQLLAWAAARGLGRLSMWSITRDTPCTVDTSVAGDTCSGLDEDTGVFSEIFQDF
jgi:hypothetical protein